MASNMPKERTLMYNGLLPLLPLPELEQTCSKYLMSVKSFLTEDEYRQTEFVVDTFRTRVGKILLSRLKERAQKRKNWKSDWWEDIYTGYRDPLPYFSNIGGVSDYSKIWKPARGFQVYRM